MRHDWLVRLVGLQIARVLIDSHIAEDDFVDGLFVIVANVLPLLFDVDHPALFDDFLNGVLQEALIGKDLLGHQAVLLEVAVNHLPAVLVVDGVVHVRVERDVGLCHLVKLIITGPN